MNHLTRLLSSTTMYLSNHATEGEAMTTAMTTATNTKGTKYLIARARKDGRVTGLLRDIALYASRGDVVLAEQSRRTLDDLVFGWDDGKPAYTSDDVTAAAEEISR